MLVTLHEDHVAIKTNGCLNKHALPYKALYLSISLIIYLEAAIIYLWDFPVSNLNVLLCVCVLIGTFDGVKMLIGVLGPSLFADSSQLKKKNDYMFLMYVLATSARNLWYI